MFFLSAFLVGFLGSFHCVGMCGPIALALPVNKTSANSILTGRLLYNAGRIFTYSILGSIIGLIGHTIALAGFQKNLSIASGIFLLAFALGSFAFSKFNSPNFILIKFTSTIKNIFRKLFGRKSKLTLFLIGSANGLLPCGFVYLALLAAAASGNFFDGMGYMMLFGLGTLPVMFSISLAGNFFGIRFQRNFKKATPVIAAILAIFLIVRGVNMHNGCHHL